MAKEKNGQAAEFVKTFATGLEKEEWPDANSPSGRMNFRKKLVQAKGIIDTLTAKLVQKETALTDCRLLKDRAEHLREEAEQRLAEAQAKNENLQAHAGHTPKCAVRAGLELKVRPDRNCDCGLVEIETEGQAEQLAAVQAKNEKLREYARCKPGCNAEHSDKHDCTCGYRKEFGL